MKKTYFKNPLEDRVVIEPDKAPTETESGIIIPETLQQKMTPARGTIIAMGPGVPDKVHQKLKGYLVNGVFKEELEDEDDGQPLYEPAGMPVSIGMRVLYSKQAGLPIEDPNSKKIYLIMRVTDCWISL